MTEQKRKIGLLRFGIGILILGLLGLIWLALYTKDFSAFEIESESMEPTFLVGDRLIVMKYRGEGIQRGDVVVLESPDDDPVPLIKRIVAVPGDVMRVRQQRLYVNNELCEPPDPNYSWNSWPQYAYDVTLKDDQYFVLGDNRPNSYDSRDYGYMHDADIIGIPIYRYAPADRRGKLAPDGSME